MSFLPFTSHMVNVRTEGEEEVI